MKICMNCSKPASERKRICNTCGGKAIWRKPTCEEIAARNTKSDEMNALLNSLLEGRL